MSSFGKKSGSSISEGLARTRPVRYRLGDKGKFGSAGRDDDQPDQTEIDQNGQPVVAKKATKKVDGTAKKPPLKAEQQPEFRTADALSAMEGLGDIKEQILPRVMERIDVEAAAQLDGNELATELHPILTDVLQDLDLTMNRREQAVLEQAIIDELLGLGPLEILLADQDITDIMVNGPKQVYVEKGGKLQLTDITFRDNSHVMHIATRIVSRIGRRVDQMTPLADARLADGSRVNVIIPPLALKGPTISIRKFSKQPIDFNKMLKFGSLSPQMVKFMRIVGRCQLNVIISGGTGSGKTTMLNAMSGEIDLGERIVTIEDAAELQLQQPHVVPLETRPANLEGEGEITIRDLVINALRMRPDRIILGEVRGPECIDMMQAMNTGHDGSMCTLHANSPREALTRLQNMAMMSGLKYPMSAIRTQIAEAIDIVIQVSRMRDGIRRTTHITEIVGMEGDVIVTQDLFRFHYEGEGADGQMIGRFECTGLRPHCYEKVNEFGLGQLLIETMSGKDVENF